MLYDLKIILRPVEDDDLPLLEAWLRKERILKWYNDADEWLYEIRERHGEFAFLNHSIVLAGGVPIGFGQWYDCFDAREEWYAVEGPDEMFSIDYLIGEDDYLGMGYGKAIVKALVCAIRERQPEAVIVAQPDLENAASGGVLLAGGFRYDEDKKYFHNQPNKDMKTIFLFLTTGFEEIEALATVDILRRGGLDVKTVSLTGDRQVTGGHRVPVIADLLFEEADFHEAQMLVLPGGTPHYNDHEDMKGELLAFAGRGGKIAAICASPMVLGGLGLLEGRNATCYPGFEQYLTGATLQTDKAVVVDGNITTGRGPGLTIDFALELVEQAAGKQKRDEVAAGLLVK